MPHRRRGFLWGLVSASRGDWQDSVRNAYIRLKAKRTSVDLLGQAWAVSNLWQLEQPNSSQFIRVDLRQDAQQPL